MSMNDEKPMSSRQLGELFGFGPSYMCALKKAAGIRRHFVFPSEIRKFLREHPGFKYAQVYHPSACTCEAGTTKRQNPKKRGRSAAVALPPAAVEAGSQPVQSMEVSSPSLDAANEITPQPCFAQRGESRPNIARAVESLLKAKELNQFWLAKQGRFSVSKVSRLLTGRVRCDTQDLCQLLEAFEKEEDKKTSMG